MPATLAFNVQYGGKFLTRSGMLKQINKKKPMVVARPPTSRQGAQRSHIMGDLSFSEKQKITINTIFCGSHAQGISQSWQDGALLADGMYVNIDHNRTVAAVQAPQDAEIAKLNRELNQTYVARGNVGQKAKRRQEALDDKAQEQSAETAVSRAVAKAGKYYDAADWDVVDAVESEKLDLASAKNEELPEKMRGMSVEERKAYVEELAAKRAHLRDQITKLNEERKVHVASKQKQGGANGLNNAIIDGLKKEASKKNFDLK